MKLARQQTDKLRNPSWQDIEVVNRGEVLFISATFRSEQCIPDELLQVLSPFMNPVSIIVNLFSVGRHLSGLHKHRHTQST